MLTFTRVLGIKVHVIDMAGAVEQIRGWARDSRESHHVVTVGTEMVMAAQGDPRLARIIEEASMVIPDTSGIVWASRRRGTPLPEKVAGIELVGRLAARAAEEGWGIYLLGGRPGTAARAAAEFVRRHPLLRIAGTSHGYESDPSAVVETIRRSRAGLLLVGMGSPKQECWLAEHLAATGVPVGIGVGGSFDVLAGELKRAPRWMVRCQLEWLFRLIQEPRRWRRMLALPRFVWKVLMNRELPGPPRNNTA